jgi:hypothetical protein
MDIEEFVKGVQPRKKRSRLLPFRDQIMALKTQGYTDLQIRDWLALNKIDVSREMVRKFVAQQGTEKTAGTMKVEPNEKPNSTKAITSHDKEPEKPTTSQMTQADKIRAKLEEQKRDAESKHFKHDKTGNL